MPSPFPCSPVICECSRKKTQIEKKLLIFKFIRGTYITQVVNQVFKSMINLNQASFKCLFWKANDSAIVKLMLSITGGVNYDNKTNAENLG